MRKELKYLFYVITILSFIIFVGNYYFSDQNKKNSYRSIISYEDKISNQNNDLIILSNNTSNIIEYVESNFDNDKKKYKFWELLKNVK
tara:strand:+ start:197 stop:460 length:264 start_codon:yes stop_codon:yes gene_type:complete